MKPDFDYNLIPHSFGYCLNSTCIHAAKCLRQLATSRIPKERNFITLVNPVSIAPSGKDCPHFKADSLLQFAQGMTHLLDHIPHNDAIIIKQQMLNYFGKNYYYRLWRKERLFTPSQQKYVRQLFEHRGISDAPVFDEYIEQYEW